MIQYAYVTDKGGRAVNEDAVAAVERDGAYGFIVCDGLGGHGSGDLASAGTVQRFRNVFARGIASGETALRTFFAEAQEGLLADQERMKARNRMKTTAAALVIGGGKVYIGHVGDSRVYGFAGGEAVLQTRDHSVPEALFRAGRIREEEIRFHPDRNKLLNVLGAGEGRFRFSMEEPRKLRQFQAFLLCSDGFWEYVDEKMMCLCLRGSRNASEWLDRMTSELVRAGRGHEMDNYSAVAVWNR